MSNGDAPGITSDTIYPNLFIQSKSFVGEVTVTYTLNGVDYMNNTFLKYNYVEHPLVTRIDPIRGPTTGGTVVRVIGQNFNLGDTDVQCRFGDIVVDSEYYSSTSVACVAPPLKRNYTRLA